MSRDIIVRLSGGETVSISGEEIARIDAHESYMTGLTAAARERHLETRRAAAAAKRLTKKRASRAQ